MSDGARDLAVGLAVAVLVVMPVALMVHWIPYRLIYPGRPVFMSSLDAVKLPEMAQVAMLTIRPPGGRVKTEVWVLGMEPLPRGWRLRDTGMSARVFESAEGDTGVEVVVVGRDTVGGRWGAAAGSARWVNGVVAAMNEREGRQ